jgi:hypothetical protein
MWSRNTEAVGLRAPFFRWLGFALIACWVIAPLIVRPGMPLFVHDWVWSPYAAHTLWTAHFLYSSWSLAGLGTPNSAVTLNPLAWLKIALCVVFDGRIAQLVYLGASLAIAFAGVDRLARHNLAIAPRFAWLAVFAFAGSPFVFAKIASGQSSYWPAMAAFVWGVSLAEEALRSRNVSRALAAAVCFALATLQAQFLIFAVIATVLLAVARPRAERSWGLALVIVACTPVLVFPEVWFLFVRGPEHGAAISQSYPAWRRAQSSALPYAPAMLGYAARYVERSLGQPPFGVVAVIAAALAMIGFGVAGLRAAPSPLLRALCLFGIVGVLWIAGVDGPAAPVWNLALDRLPSASYVREFFHAAIFVALGLTLAFSAGIEVCARRAPRVFAIGIVLVAVFGAATWSLGLARALPMTAPRDDRSVVAGAADAGRIDRVAFLPARVQLASPGDDIGGNDGTDWSDARRRSIFQFYLRPVAEAAVDALHAGDVRGVEILERLGCDAIDARSWVRSFAYGARSDATSGALSRAGFASRAGDQSRVYRLAGYPLLALAQHTDALPGDLRAMRHDFGLVYLDVPGDDAADRLQLTTYRPDPQLGWVPRRDIPDAIVGGPGGPSNGIATTFPGARIALVAAPGTRALVWSQVPNALELNGTPVSSLVPTWIAGGPRIDARATRGAVAIYEIGERPFALDAPLSRIVPAATVLDAQAIAPWQYAMRLKLSGAAVVVLREQFDAKWQLAGDGVAVVRHLRADGFGNAWLVRGTGVRTITITYADQAPAWVLLALSGTLFVALLVTTLAIETRYRAKRRQAPAYRR